MHRTDGISAMHLALTTSFDVIVLDLMLPGMDGLSFCQKLRADAKLETPVLMLTARDTLDDKLKGVAAGADDYLVKPFAFLNWVFFMPSILAVLVMRAVKAASEPPIASPIAVAASLADLIAAALIK